MNASVLSPEWRTFQRWLSAALARLAPDEFLIIDWIGTNRFVQFAVHDDGLIAEVVSNHYLPGDEQLGAGELRALATMGWHPPVARPGDPPDAGSPNHRRDWDAPVPIPEVACAAIGVLLVVFHVPDPGDLAVDAFHASGRPIDLEPSGLG